MMHLKPFINDLDIEKSLTFDLIRNPWPVSDAHADHWRKTFSDLVMVWYGIGQTGCEFLVMNDKEQYKLIWKFIIYLINNLI